MDHLHSTTTEHRKGKHLSYEERVIIQTRRKDGWNPNRIAREIGCAPNTVRNEIKRVIGRSIEDRPSSIDDRTEFGHWEADQVIGSKSDNDDALLTMIKRKTREYWMIRVPGRDLNGVMEALREVRCQYSEHWDDIFETITTDNGSEFSLLSGLEELSKTLVYFAHPYTSCEKGSVERHNGLIRRFIPKGRRIDSYSDEQICQIEVWCNSLPRKILGYSTPDELFEDELSKIYTIAA